MQLARYDGRWKVINGALMFGGATLCTVGTGGTGAALCALGIANAVLGANRAAQGLDRYLNGRFTVSTIEQKLIEAGVSKNRSREYLQSAEGIIALMDLAVGCVAALRSLGIRVELKVNPNTLGANGGGVRIVVTRVGDTPLTYQLLAQQIANGHSFSKHILRQGEFVGLGVRTRAQLAKHIENVLINPSDVRYARDGRIYYLQESIHTVVIRNPKAEDGGTAFQPRNWDEYIQTLPKRTKPC